MTPSLEGSLTSSGGSSEGMLGGSFSQIANLFEEDLLKFDKIKSTQKMLTPFINLRKYG